MMFRRTRRNPTATVRDFVDGPIIPDAVDADIASREFESIDNGDGSYDVTLGGVPFAGPIVAPGAIWSSLAGKPAVIAGGPTAAKAREAIGLDPIIVTDAVYGARGDAVEFTDATISAGSKICTSASNKFTADMVDKVIIIRAGTGQAPMVTTVESFQNAGQITLSDPAITNAAISGGPNINAIIGTDNSAAFADAFAAAAAKSAAASSHTKRYQTVAQVYVPAGTYLTITGVPALQEPGISMVGAGPNATRVWHCGADAFLQMGTYTPTPAWAWAGTASRLRVGHLTLHSPLYDGKEGSRVGIGIQDNGCGNLHVNDVVISGFKYGIYGAYGSDFSTFGPNLYVRYCDVGMYLGPGSQQILMHSVDITMCLEGLVNEGAPQGAMIGCFFEDNKVSDITYDGVGSGTTRSGVPWNLPGGNHFGAWSHTGCWFESGSSGVDRNNDHHIWIKSTVHNWVGWRGLAFRDCLLISGGRAQVVDGTNSFITDEGQQSANPLIDNFTIVGKSINGIYRYTGAAGTSDVALRNWRAITPSSGIVAIIGETDISTISNPMANLMTSRELTLDDVTITGSQVNTSTFTSPKINAIFDTLGKKILEFIATVNSVNWVEIVGSITGSALQIRANGADADIALQLRGKGNKSVEVRDSLGIYPVSVRVGIPASSTTAGKPGYWAANSSYICVYTGDGTTHSWVRTAAATW